MGQRDEGHVRRDEAEAGGGPVLRKGAAGDVAGIDALVGHHPLIGAQLGGELVAAHVQAHHPGRALLQQQVGEAACALTHVQAGAALNGQAAVGQRAFELEAPARHETQLRVVGHLDLGLLRHILAGLGRYGPALGAEPAHGPALDQPLGGRAGGREAALEDQLIDSHGKHLGGSDQRKLRIRLCRSAGLTP